LSSAAIHSYLEDRNETYWRMLDRLLDKHQGNPRAQLSTLVEHIVARTTTPPGYRGCPFINYAAEFPDPSHPGAPDRNRQQAEDAGSPHRPRESDRVRDASRLADALFLIVEGPMPAARHLAAARDLPQQPHGR